MDTAFFASVRSSLYDGALSQHQVNCLNAIDAAWEQYGDGDIRKLAYILATAHHETGAFKWLKEVWGPTKAQQGYEGRADLGNTVAGDGKKFMGRGFCQITGRRNYTDWSKRTGLDLLKEPQLAETPAVAARILVQGSMLGTFTGKKLGDYIDSNTLLLIQPPQPKVDYAGARRVINGTDKAALIAGYARAFETALGLADPGAGPVPLPLPPVAPIPTVPPPESAKGRGVNWGAVTTILSAIGLVAVVVYFIFIKR